MECVIAGLEQAASGDRVHCLGTSKSFKALLLTEIQIDACPDAAHKIRRKMAQAHLSGGEYNIHALDTCLNRAQGELLEQTRCLRPIGEAMIMVQNEQKQRHLGSLGPEPGNRILVPARMRDACLTTGEDGLATIDKLSHLFIRRAIA